MFVLLSTDSTTATDVVHHDEFSYLSMQPGEPIKMWLFNALYYFALLCKLGMPNIPLFDRMLRTVVVERLKVIDASFSDHSKLALKIVEVGCHGNDARIKFNILNKETLREYTCYVFRLTDALQITSSTTLAEKPYMGYDAPRRRVKYL